MIQLLNNKLILADTINLLSTHRNSLFRCLLIPLILLASFELLLLPDHLPNGKSLLGLLYLATSFFIFFIYANIAVVIHQILILAMSIEQSKFGVKPSVKEWKYIWAIAVLYILPFIGDWALSDWKLSLTGYSDEVLRVIFLTCNFVIEVFFIVLLSFGGLVLPHIAIKNEIDFTHALRLSKGHRTSLFLTMFIMALIWEGLYLLSMKFFHVDSITLILIDWIVFTFIGIFNVAILSLAYKRITIKD
ncbi:hypothetical protein RI844_18090 [Thalassotalea fonticola]|uniref:Uncharacterized protein n=1 Tax=Thalassotalea fonticola TaxID=3065649 RepID=A0ABZ0GNH7_9GAMM|nr:hypothetical protein RI844_18090 [Colwelliaceae bacterium S1-1]